MARYEHLPIYKEAFDLALYFEKTVRSITPSNDPRELQVTLLASVTYRDLRTGQLRAGRGIRGGTREIAVIEVYYLELGESIATASNRAVRKMARRIVELMEVAW